MWSYRGRPRVLAAPSVGDRNTWFFPEFVAIPVMVACLSVKIIVLKITVVFIIIATTTTANGNGLEAFKAETGTTSAEDVRTPEDFANSGAAFLQERGCQ